MIYCFGAYELDESARELRQDGVRVETEPKAFELLLYLAQHRDRAVPKDELLNELWPRQIVTETALTRCVMKARRAVGDDSTTQSVIRTVHRHGYRFVAELEPGTADAAADARRPAAGPPAAALPRPGRAAVLAALGILLLLAAAGIWLREQERAPDGVVAVLPVTNLVDGDGLGWVRVGLMSLLTRMLKEGGVPVAAERRVLNAVGDLTLAGPPGSALFDRIRAQSGADTVLHTVLDVQGGLHRLAAVVTHPDGRQTRRIIVGESPAKLAAELDGVIAGLLSSADAGRPERFRKISTDPFVNEMYARALDLELQGRLEEAREMFRVAASQAPELFWLRYEIALCTRDLREWAEAEAMFETLLAEAEAGADARALIVVLNSHGILHLRRNEYDEASRMFERAHAVMLERGEPADRESVLINLALINTRQGNFEAARGYYADVVELYERIDKQPSPFFLNNYAGFLMQHGDLKLARQYSEKAVAGFRLAGQRRYEAPSLNRLARIMRRLGDLDAAIERHRQAIEIYRELDDEIGELVVLSALTSVYRDKGDLTRARLNAAEVLDRTSRTDDELLLADAIMQSARVAGDLDAHDEALANFETAREIYERLGDDAGMRGAATGIALTALELGDAGRAASIAAAMLAATGGSADGMAHARARWLAGKVAEAGGDADVAIGHFTAALDYGRRHADREIRRDAGQDLALLLLRQGDDAAASALVDELRPIAAASHDFLRLDARVAIARQEHQRAAAILAELRKRAGEAWNTEDDALLAGLGD